MFLFFNLHTITFTILLFDFINFRNFRSKMIGVHKSPPYISSLGLLPSRIYPHISKALVTFPHFPSLYFVFSNIEKFLNSGRTFVLAFDYAEKKLYLKFY